MAEFKSTQLTARQSTPPVKTAPTDHGKLMVAVATKLQAADPALNDTFATGIVLPKGSRLLRTGKLAHGAFGAGSTLDVGLRGTDGTVIDADGIAAALNTAATNVRDLSTGAFFQTAAGTLLTQDAEVYCTFTGADPAANQPLEIEIHYIAPTT